MSHGSALAAICLAADSWPTKTTKKFAGLDPRSEEAYYKLVAYALDIARKLEYVYKATRPFALEADPALAAEIKRDNETLERVGTNWRALAEETEKILLRLMEKSYDDHEKILALAATELSKR